MAGVLKNVLTFFYVTRTIWCAECGSDDEMMWLAIHPSFTCNDCKKNNHLKKKNVPGSKMKASAPQIVPHFEVRIF